LIVSVLVEYPFPITISLGIDEIGSGR